MRPGTGSGAVSHFPTHMHPAPQGTVTDTLRAAALEGADPAALLFPLVYEELRVMARRQLARERVGHTLCTTALVHDAYLKLAGRAGLEAQGRAYFFGAAVRAMRQILIDHARRVQVRDAKAPALTVHEETADIDAFAADIIDLNTALERLAQIDERAARVIECRFFGGLSVEETAEVLAVSPRTVKRDWMIARAWLYRELDRQEGD
jgi:RNA polymerase sigma-70 factor, ECF subfamily